MHEEQKQRGVFDSPKPTGDHGHFIAKTLLATISLHFG
jgi:hypothetical protein